MTNFVKHDGALKLARRVVLLTTRRCRCRICRSFFSRSRIAVALRHRPRPADHWRHWRRHRMSAAFAEEGRGVSVRPTIGGDQDFVVATFDRATLPCSAIRSHDAHAFDPASLFALWPLRAGRTRAPDWAGRAGVALRPLRPRRALIAWRTLAAARQAGQQQSLSKHVPIAFSASNRRPTPEISSTI